MQKPQWIGELFGIPGMPCSYHICTTAPLNCMASKYIWPILHICVQAVANHAVCKYESGLRVPYTNLVWLYVVSEGSRTNLAMWCLASLGCRTNQVWGYRIRIWYDYMWCLKGPVRIWRCDVWHPWDAVRIRSEGTVRIRSDWGCRTSQV